MKQVKALVLTGYGINCEREMAYACDLAGGKAEILHAKRLLKDPSLLDQADLLCFPGGFSFGDELGAAKALANRLTYAGGLKEKLLAFVQSGKCILGICNGFQLLVKLGLLPGPEFQSASLAANDSCRFENRWTHHKALASHCVFTRNLDTLYLPVRHGEGKFVLRNPNDAIELFASGQVVLQYVDGEGAPTEEYPANPNGSPSAIAGICDSSGRILGMMAHPEAALLPTHHPRWHRMRAENNLPNRGPGLALFENAIQYLKETL